MSQDNQFYQYGYDHYLKAPKKQVGNAPKSSSGLRGRLNRKLKSPAVATVALLGAGALFAGVIFITYPSDKGAQQPIPIVKADLTPIKEVPEERGGMHIPQRDSTILAQVGQPAVQVDTAEVENLLARTPEEWVSKEKALEEAMRSNPMMPDDSSLSSQSVESGDEVIVLSSQDDGFEGTVQAMEMPELQEPKPLFDPDSVGVNVSAAIPDLKEPDAGDILQKIGAADSDDKDVGEFAKMTSKAAMIRKPLGHVAVASSAVKPSQMHAAAQSPETLEFVRSVLNSNGDDVSEIEPASGVSSASSAIEKQALSVPEAIVPAAGDYFVQLASITDAARAGSEWGKMKAKYVSLSSSDFRVQEANLSSGKFYRIQAGPMSKDSAEQVCNALKQAGKPGGCLVVK